MKITATKVIIRTATEADAKEIFAIRANARATAYKGFLAPKSWASFKVQNALSPENLAKWLKNVKDYLAQTDIYIFRVATINDTVVGWSLSDIRRDQVHLMRLFVGQNLQGYGVGSKLLNDLYEFAGDKRITLTVLRPNVHAINFYKKHGFTELGEARYNYLSVPCVKMQKQSPHLDKSTV